MPPSRRPDPTKSWLCYGDNLDVMREYLADESVDLVYLDPPFNSNRSYSLLFKEASGAESQAQMEAFDDTWTWSQESEHAYDEMVNDQRTPYAVQDCLTSLRRLLGDNDVMAYLTMMTARLIELHRVLRDTGSIYLHCDPTASHYLKIILDAIFGPANFRNEIIWKRTGSHGSAKKYGPVHDVILFYAKSEHATWNQTYGPYDPDYIADKFNKRDDASGLLFQDISLTGPDTRNGESGLPWGGYDPTAKGRHWALPGFLVEAGIIPDGGTVQERLTRLDKAGRIYRTRNGTPRLKFFVDDGKGMPLADVWTDIPALNSQAAERLGYPTQKPLALLDRIIKASSNEGDTVLDPFCGCGTATDSAQRLGRRWIGIDITTLAVDLIDARLRHTFGEAVAEDYEMLGIPRDLAGAAALFRRSPFEFERWAVGLVNGQPNERQVSDRGSDGVVRFPLGRGEKGRVIVSVKGGSTNPGHVRDLVGVVSSQRAEMGLFVTMNPPTRGMTEAANQSGTYVHPANGQRYPKVQILSIGGLLDGSERPNMPPAENPYFTARRGGVENTDPGLF